MKMLALLILTLFLAASPVLAEVTGEPAFQEDIELKLNVQAPPELAVPAATPAPEAESGAGVIGFLGETMGSAFKLGKKMFGAPVHMIGRIIGRDEKDMLRPAAESAPKVSTADHLEKDVEESPALHLASQQERLTRLEQLQSVRVAGGIDEEQRKPTRREKIKVQLLLQDILSSKEK
ncbi:MAG: hypothetical protein HUU16_21040 [Candidatus Omnitrophica bacterium]|nr:hypothetical protein [bacterium]NUN98649.1 hypothetical protein [Candidatus Omnitrophota bacterium]